MTPPTNKAQDLDEFFRLYVERPGYKRSKAKAAIESLIANQVAEARIDEVKLMPHQYDPNFEMHEMSDDSIPLPKKCNCYKGRRLAALKAGGKPELREK